MGTLARLPARPVGNGTCPSKPPKGDLANRNSVQTLFLFLRIILYPRKANWHRPPHQKMPSTRTPLGSCEPCLSFWIAGTKRRKSMKNDSRPANVNITLDGSD